MRVTTLFSFPRDSLSPTRTRVVDNREATLTHGSRSFASANGKPCKRMPAQETLSRSVANTQILRNRRVAQERGLPHKPIGDGSSSIRERSNWCLVPERPLQTFGNNFSQASSKSGSSGAIVSRIPEITDHSGQTPRSVRTLLERRNAC